MKIIFVILFLAVYFTTAKSDDGNIKCSRFLEDAVIRQLFELLKLLIKEGSVANYVPILDPLRLENKQINLVDNGYTIQAEFSNFSLRGLGDFEILDTAFDKDDISLALNMKFPVLSIFSERYNMIGEVYSILPLLGNGLMSIEVHDLIFRSKVYLRQSADGKSILIENFSKTQFEVDTIVSRTEFDGNIDHILNTMVEDLLANYLTRFSKFISAQYEDNAKQFLNQYLNHFESWRLIAAIL